MKTKLGIIFGGKSVEHEISIITGNQAINVINTEKYEIVPIYISKKGLMYTGKELLDLNNYKDLNSLLKKVIQITLVNDGEKVNLVKYPSSMFGKNILNTIDVVIPTMHGTNGEDGAIQGLLEMLQIPYVGCGILASSIGMDKIYTKAIIEKAGIKQANYCYIKVINNEYILVEKDFSETNSNIKEIARKVKEELGFPVFVKPSNSGSSIGISRANNRKELEQAITEASKYDVKILIEENIDGREIECAILQIDKTMASCTGEIIPAEDYYTFEAKYNNPKSVLKIPSQIECESEVQKLAIKAFKAIDGKGLARVDFFVTDNGDIYLNEINTMPGFTAISMYPKLWKASGLNYTELLDKLIACY